MEKVSCCCFFARLLYPLSLKLTYSLSPVDYSQMGLEELMTVYNEKLNEPVKPMKQIAESNCEQILINLYCEDLEVFY